MTDLCMKVKVEEYRTPRRPIQCHKCQRLGTVDNCCSAEKRPVKCGNNHPAKECAVKREDFSCALCSGNHPATYRGCPVYKEKAKQKYKTRNPTQKLPNEKKTTKPTVTDSDRNVSPPQIAPDNTRSQNSFADVTKSRKCTQKLPPSTVKQTPQPAKKPQTQDPPKTRRQPKSPEKQKESPNSVPANETPPGKDSYYLLSIYLGVILDNRLTWNLHVNEILKKSYARFAQLYPLLNRTSSFSVKADRDIYLMLLRPILTYASPVWGYTDRSKINKILVFQNKVLRMVAHAPLATKRTVLHRDLKVPSIKGHIIYLGARFYEKLQSIDNGLINQLRQRPTSWDKYKRPSSLLDEKDAHALTKRPKDLG
ncbi:hypothetical protein AAG570_004529 [Ranatra chinensis]|uniref:RNA-directed DNA polymerase from mobile element jockey n=1 Tax=Ranatra chinensis TaxID=642074 RepID=A0ABD0Y142_9HEMI